MQTLVRSDVCRCTEWIETLNVDKVVVRVILCQTFSELSSEGLRRTVHRRTWEVGQVDHARVDDQGAAFLARDQLRDQQSRKHHDVIHVGVEGLLD